MSTAVMHAPARVETDDVQRAISRRNARLAEAPRPAPDRPRIAAPAFGICRAGA